MATRLEVQRFLRTFHAKLKVFDILFRDDRGKNQQALFDLDITPVFRVEIIRSLAVTDYSAGPIVSELGKNTEMWVFGKDVKQRGLHQDQFGIRERIRHLHIISFGGTRNEVSL